jgi:hypothetical protein
VGEGALSSGKRAVNGTLRLAKVTNSLARLYRANASRNRKTLFVFFNLIPLFSLFF